MTVSYEEAEKIRAEYRKMLAEKEAKAKLPDETVSSSKSDEPSDEEILKKLADAGKIPEDKPKKKRGRPKKKD